MTITGQFPQTVWTPTPVLKDSMMAHSAEPAARHEVRGTLAQGVARLESARVASAQLAAELLLLHLLGRDRAWLYAHPEHVLSSDEFAQYDDLLRRRAEGVPVQYLTGRQEFWGLEFEVNPSVLIPRPETEHLIEVALDRLAERRSEPLRIADVGTGSGCIAVALAREFSTAQITATDISPAALEVAQRNAVRHGVQDRIDTVLTNLLQSFFTASESPRPMFDLIVSNPPYVGSAGQSHLQREVVEHEPHLALFAGEQGLDIYPELFAQAAKLLRPGGLLIVEIGYGQAGSVAALIAADTGWTGMCVTNDLAGIPRVLAAARV
jgi:release factor glutamine methyltransferase